MPRLRRFLKTISRPTITTSRDLARFVAILTTISLLIALTIDIINQLAYFTGWDAAIRSWLLTVFTVLVIAVPASLLFGRAQRNLQRSKRALEVLSNTDSLTSLPNRRALMEASEKSSSQAMVLAIADVDRFKVVNDTHGHHAGDMMLQMVGKTMAFHLQRYGVVGRLGGEEFALVAPGGDLDEIVAAMEVLLRAIAATSVVVPAGAAAVTISVGIAVSRGGGPFERLYSEADEALYLAKRRGRNRIELSPGARAMSSRKTSASLSA